MAGRDDVQDLAALLRRAGPLLRTAPADVVAARLGWPVHTTFPNHDVMADTGTAIDTEGNGGALSVTDGTVSWISAALTDLVAVATPDARDFLVDAFASASAATRDVLGPPTTETPGRSPSLAWRFPDVTVELAVSVMTVSISVRRTADADAQAEADNWEDG